jgi:hypothetical protein
MNERIKELAYEAEDYADSIVDQGGEFHPAYTKKFAELIMEECRYVMDCNKGSDQHTEWNKALSETSNKILEHFGVEE